ncbi:MAG: CAP domain-containing protein [Dehalococcoidia bacterium]
MRTPRALSSRLLGSLVALGLLAGGVSTARPVHAAPEAATLAAALQTDEDGLVQAINQRRTNQGLVPLTTDPMLMQIARQRSQDQVSRHYFSHTAPEGTNIFDLLGKAQVNFSAAGENLAESQGQDPVQAAIDAFMYSPAHRDNVLNPGYGHVGVGAAMSDDGTTLLTVVFTN